MRFPFLRFEQPAGDFILSSMPATDIIRIARPVPRKFNAETLQYSGGIQREPSNRRIGEVGAYSATVDAAFPTPILLALDADTYSIEGSEIVINQDSVADVVDGQHRLLGLQESGRAPDFVLPVVFILEPTAEQKALLFATINGTQTKVPASLIFDLFGVTKGRSPQKTSHEIARALNGTATSPWHRRLKMLGRKTPGSEESLSQGTFVKHLLPLISSDPVGDMDKIRRGQEPPPHPRCVFNEYFVREQDPTILKILMNVFSAQKNCWNEEWEQPGRFILTKTTGFTGTMRALPALIAAGKLRQDLSEQFFTTVFTAAKAQIIAAGKQLTSEHFPSGSSGEASFEREILRGLPQA